MEIGSIIKKFSIHIKKNLFLKLLTTKHLKKSYYYSENLIKISVNEYSTTMNRT